MRFCHSSNGFRVYTRAAVDASFARYLAAVRDPDRAAA
jgi:hypothetical protein